MTDIRESLVAEIDEHKLVSLILDVLSKFQSNSLIVQPGDDAAVLQGLAKPTITSDILIEDVHFKRIWSSPADIGTRAAAANLADLIAMGAEPKALTVSLGIPEKTAVGYVLDLTEAIAAEAQLIGAQVVGGDVTKSEKLVVSITAVGDCENRTPILRSGARAGDRVGLIGRLGFAQAGLQLMQSGKSAPLDLILAHQRPRVDYSTGKSAWQSSNAMIDVSDGLLVDLGHIAKASNVRISLSSNLLQNLITSDLKVAGKELGVEPIEFVLSGGDDHAFVVSGMKLPSGAVEIGSVASGAGVWLDNEPADLLGYRHFNG